MLFGQTDITITPPNPQLLPAWAQIVAYVFLAAVGPVFIWLKDRRKLAAEEKKVGDDRADKAYLDRVTDAKSDRKELLDTLKEIQKNHLDCEKKHASLEAKHEEVCERLTSVEDSVVVAKQEIVQVRKQADECDEQRAALIKRLKDNGTL